MTTYLCSTEPDPEKRDEPDKRSSVRMAGNWTYHAYVMSHDRKSNIFFHHNGFTLQRGRERIRYRTMISYGTSGVYWSPDNRRATFFATAPPDKDAKRPTAAQAVAVLDITKCSKDQEGQAPPWDYLYVAPNGHNPFGIEWSPKGDAVYVIERMRVKHKLSTRIIRVSLAKKVTQVAAIGGLIDFFMPPVSRFEHGGGPSRKPYWIIFGHARGLFITDPKGRHQRRVAELPAVGLYNVEWHPRKDQVALYFRRPAQNADGEKFRGIHIVRLDRLGRSDKGALHENIYNNLNVHTMWYSPKGTYISWATPSAIYYRRPNEPAAKTVRFEPMEGELELEVKGFTWHHSERKIAYTAGHHVFVHQIRKKIDPKDKKAKQPKPDLKIASFGKEETHFTAEPVWIGDKVFLTVFEDITRKRSNKTAPIKTKTKEEVKQERAKEAKRLEKEAREKARRGGRGK